jgi:hypothetical protein
MKRSTLKKFILLSLSVIIVFLFTIVIQKISHESKVESIKHYLEDFPLIESDGSQTSSTTRCNGTTVLILFNSTCEHCQAEIKDIKAHHILFNETTIAFISTEPLEAINTFASDLNLGSFGNMKWYQISHDDLYKHFGTVSQTYPVYCHSIASHRCACLPNFFFGYPQKYS